MPTRLKNYYTKADCRRLRKLFVKRMHELTDNGLPVYLLLSGGMDSVTILYALLEAKIPFKAYTFYFDGVPSSDKAMVEQIHKAIPFDLEYLKFPSEWDALKDEVINAVALCRMIYGRIREVKVETILAYSLLKKAMPAGRANVINGAQVALMYSTNDAMWISAVGEYSPEVDKARRGEFSEPLEETYIFERVVSPYVGGCVEDFLCGFTVSACHWKKPKSILYYPFEDYHKRANSYRKPRPFQKASNEKALFNRIALERGYNNARELFKGVTEGEG